MKTVIIYAHPNPISFNAALAEVVQEEMEKLGSQVKVKDLYGMDFNPCLGEEDFKAFRRGDIPADIQEEQDDISWADHLVFIAPIWWINFPAILKGYFDRVFSAGFAYKVTSQGFVGLLNRKKVLVITTSGADRAQAEKYGMLDVLKATIAGIFTTCGFSSCEHINLYAVPSVYDQEREEMLVEVKKTVLHWAAGMEPLNPQA